MQITTVSILVVIAGCKAASTGDGENVSVAVPVASTSYVTPTAAATAKGRKLATVASLPRKDWPTGLVEYGRKSLQVTSRGTFTYDSDAPCTLPVMAHEDGIVGCPTAYSYGDYKDVYEYDAERRFLGRNGKQYVWAEDGLERVFAMPVVAVTTEAANLAMVNPENESYHRHFKVENGHYVAGYRTSNAKDLASAFENPEATLVWSATRLEAKLQKYSKTYFEYADTPVTKRAEDLEREKREAADRDATEIATVASVPREHWPCEAITEFADGDGRRIEFIYDDRTRCRLAAELHAEGVVGCPKAVVVHETRADGTVVDPTTRAFTYDGDVMVAGILSHHKRGDGLLAGRGTFVRTADGVADKSDDVETRYTIKAGRTHRVASHSGNLSAELDLTWDAARLVQVAGEILGMKRTTTMRYDCK